jgi:phosphotransferase system  glucose/maltose/N-acetylglucosamine-specific IIC component
MTTSTGAVPSTDKVIAMIRGELTSARRWLYRGILLVAAIGLGVILSLWTTEPRELPMRLHVAFGALSVINAVWIGVTAWILSRRRCPTALDRIATAWVSTGACVLFLCVAVGVAISRDRVGDVWWAALLGVLLVNGSLVILWRSYAQRRELQKKLVELEQAALGARS